MDKKPQLAFIPLFVTAAAACGLLYMTFLDRWVAYVMFALCAICFCIGFSRCCPTKRRSNTP